MREGEHHYAYRARTALPPALPRGAKKALSSASDGSAPQTSRRSIAITRSPRPARWRAPAADEPVVRTSRVMLGSWLRQNGAVAPQPIVGQMRATPPAVDRVMAAEIFLM